MEQNTVLQEHPAVLSVVRTGPIPTTLVANKGKKPFLSTQNVKD
jgi:hypothetical protein